MKCCAIFAGLILFISTEALAQKTSAEQFANAFSKAYSAKRLSKMDARKPYRGSITVRIQDSMDDKILIRRFKSLSKFEAWLKRRETNGVPRRQTLPLNRCRRGICTYGDDSGILHNQLYLKRLDYGQSHGKYYIKSVRLLDGD
jgi:hypothetical protein